MENGNNIELIRPNRLCNKLVFADGIGSSGKGMTSHILSCFDRIEKQSNHTPFDYISYIYWLGMMQESAAITYLQTEADQQLYHLYMSRDVNFRPSDSTGVLRNGKRLEYFKRLLKPEGDFVIDRIDNEMPILNEAPHDALRSTDLFFNAFEDLKIIYIVRDPYELIVDWQRRGFSSRIGKDPREFQFNIKVGEQIKPMFFVNYPDLEYTKMSDFERLLVMIHFCMKTNLEGYESAYAKNKVNIKFFAFNYVVTKPYNFIEILKSFLGLNYSPRMIKRIFKQEGIPRTVRNMDDYRNEVVAMIDTDKYGCLIDEIDSMYASFKSYCEERC